MRLNDIEIARALHVLFVVHWIGGVAFVTLVALPLARASEDGWARFEAVERRFSRQVKWSIPLAGATGFWMAWRLDLWPRFADPGSWPLDAMVLLWAVFMIAVFVVEPIAHPRIAAEAAHDPKAVLGRLQRAHLVLLAAAIVTILGGVAGSNGGFFQ